jgi:hypothetical protein
MYPYPQSQEFASGLPTMPGQINVEGVAWYRNPTTLLFLGAIVLALAAAGKVRPRVSA